MGVWVCLSVSIILVNKQVMFYSGFHFPCTLAFWHMFLATVTARFAVWAWDLPDAISQQKSSGIYMQVAMIGLLFGGTLVAGNAALLYLSVPTIQMLKVGAVASSQQWGGTSVCQLLVQSYDSHQVDLERV